MKSLKHLILVFAFFVVGFGIWEFANSSEDEQTITHEEEVFVNEAIYFRNYLADSGSKEYFYTQSLEIFEKEANETLHTVTYYVVVTMATFDDKAVVKSSNSLPLALTFENLEDKPALVGYWQPKEGNDYEASIRERFPEHLWNDVLNFDASDQLEDCWIQAKHHYHIQD